MKRKLFSLIAAMSASIFCFAQQEVLKINEQEYLEMTGLNVMLAHDCDP